MLYAVRSKENYDRRGLESTGGTGECAVFGAGLPSLACPALLVPPSLLEFRTGLGSGLSLPGTEGIGRVGKLLVPGEPGREKGQAELAVCVRSAGLVREGSAEHRALLSPRQDAVPTLGARARPCPGVQDNPSTLSPQQDRECQPPCAQSCPAPEFSLLVPICVSCLWCLRVLSLCSPFQTLL